MSRNKTFTTSLRAATVRERFPVEARHFPVMKLVFSLLLAAVLLAQNPQTPVISVTTRLVEVNVIVRDHKGPVEGLTKGDFTVFDKGKQQTIDFFSVSSTHVPLKPPPPLPPNVFTNIPERRAESPTSASVVLLDYLNTPAFDQPYARAQLAKFIKAMRPEDRVAVYVLGRKLVVLSDFTADGKKLLETVEKYGVQPSDADQQNT